MTAVAFLPPHVFAPLLTVLFIIIAPLALLAWLAWSIATGAFSNRGYRQIVVAVLMACAMGSGAGLVVTLHADDEDFILRDRCRTLERYSAEWWLGRCWLYEDEDGDPPAPIVIIDNTTQPQPSKPAKKK